MSKSVKIEHLKEGYRKTETNENGSKRIEEYKDNGFYKTIKSIENVAAPEKKKNR